MEMKLRCGVVGATGMVGQRFLTLLENHPYFDVTAVIAGPRSAGKTYEEAVAGRWKLDLPMPEAVKGMTVLPSDDLDTIKTLVDFVFCAVDMKKEDIRALEERYAKAEIPVISNNSAHRWTPDVPMVIPEINDDHMEIIHAQRKRLAVAREQLYAVITGLVGTKDAVLVVVAAAVYGRGKYLIQRYHLGSTGIFQRAAGVAAGVYVGRDNVFGVV